MTAADKKKIISNLPFLIFFWIFDKLSYTVRLSEENILISVVKGVSELPKAPLLSFHFNDISVGIVGALAVKGILYLRSKNAKKFRKGIEYGSARWGTPEDIKPYIDEDFYNNILLTNTERLTMNSRPKNPKFARNKNVLVIGGSGSGKTRFFVKPNLMQMTTSYCVTDPKGTILVECGKMLQKGGYKIRSLNTINFKKSMHYNPFAYIRSETEKLHKCETEQEFMKKVNVYYKKNGTCVGCEGVSDELAAKLDENIKQAYSWDKQPFPSYRLTNNNAEIRRLKKCIENLTATQNTEFVGWKFNGGEAVINEDKNRLQLLFDEKPSKEQRETLKANGFRWVPSDTAWQRQLNPNAFYAANRIDFIKPENGERPTDLQPKAPKKSEPER